MMKLKFHFFFIAFTNLLYAQKISSDSLKVYTYDDLETKFYNLNNSDQQKKSSSIASYYLKKAKTENKVNYIAEGYVLMHLNKPLDIGLKYLDSLNSVTKHLISNKYPTRIYLLKGNLYFYYDDQIKALENYILGLKYAREKKNVRQIRIAEISIANLNNYIGKHKEAAKTFRHYLYGENDLSQYEKQDLHLNLTSTYLDINKLDSANILIKQALGTYKLDNPHLYYKYLSLDGLLYLKKKNYKLAIDELEKSKDFFIKQSNELRLSYTLMYLGQAYEGAKQEQKAIENYTKIDSLVKKTNNTFPELRDVYTSLIDHYKKTNDKEKLLYYIDRFLKVDMILDDQYYFISKELPKKYDTPKLTKEKEEVINSLEKRKFIMNISLVVLILILLLLTFLYYKSKKKQKKYKKIAQDLISSVEKKDMVTSDTKTVESLPDAPNEIIEDESKTNKIISEDISSSILKELEIFETKELFLKKGITLSSLSKQIKTNTTYLSDVINTHKGKNFATYINDLRIDYALDKLVKDKKFRSYKLVVIAEELGYNNEQAFAIAFKRKTGTTLSIYLKEIEKTVAL